MYQDKKITFIDLFAGIGGIRKGFEQACNLHGLMSECVYTSEIKKSAINVLKQNNPNEIVYGDITKEISLNIPAFDFLLAGFPCPAEGAALSKVISPYLPL